MMIKKKIKSIVGSFLVENGFELRTEKPYTSRSSCIYTRECGTITQSIFIGKSNVSEIIDFNLQTDAWGVPFAGPYNIIPEFAKIIEENKKFGIDQINSELSKAFLNSDYNMNQGGKWTYENEEEFEKALWEIRGVIEKYGLEWLEKKSIEDEFVPTDAMGKKLYDLHEKLSKNFAKKYYININDNSKENISKSLAVIRENIKEIQRQQYSEIQDELVEIAAFLGEQLRSVLKGKWALGNRERMVFITRMNIYMVNRYYPLSEVVDAWKNQDFEALEEGYLLMLDSKLPLTDAQMIELQRRWNIKRQSGE